MSRATLQQVRIERSTELVRVRLARPDRYNVLDIETLAELAVVLESEPREAVPLVLEGEGAAFSLGVDIRELANFTAAAAATYSRLGQQAVAALEAWPGVTVAHLHGYCLGTGLELALGCDVLAGDLDVRLGLPGLAWALVPCLGGLRRLNHRIGPHLTGELFLRGVVLDAPQAMSAGLIDRLVADPGELDVFLDDLREFVPGAVRAIRDLRLRHYAPADPGVEADLFAQGFVLGECQRRLKSLLA